MGDDREAGQMALAQQDWQERLALLVDKHDVPRVPSAILQGTPCTPGPARRPRSAHDATAILAAVCGSRGALLATACGTTVQQRSSAGSLTGPGAAADGLGGAAEGGTTGGELGSTVGPSTTGGLSPADTTGSASGNKSGTTNASTSGGSTGFFQVAENQKYRPRYSIDSQLPPALAAANVSPTQLHGAIGVGFRPPVDVNTTQDPGDVSPQEARCKALMTKAGVDWKADRNTELAILSACGQVWALAAALGRSRDVTPVGLRAGFESLGRVPGP